MSDAPQNSAKPGHIPGVFHKPGVFIDGEAGTTGLQIRERLAGEARIQLLSLPEAQRKDVAAKRALMAQADVVILCLPDDAAKETAALAHSMGADAPRLIDASSAHRVAPGWVYGLPELTPGQPAAIAQAARVTNPGCYPTGGVALIRPLVDAGVMPADYPVMIHAVSGYSGGGKSLIEAHESGQAPAFELYGLTQIHKHLPEITLYSGLTRMPIFVPSVGSFRQGMLVSVPLCLDTLKPGTSLESLRAVLAAHYAGQAFVRVANEVETAAMKGRVEPENLNNTNLLELFVFGNAERGQAVLVARLDNLGKGASGAAVQNLHLMLGLEG